MICGANAAPAAFAAIFLIAGLLLFLPPASFPFAYHNDEGLKVGQILAGERNFKHPVLMLEVAGLLVKFPGFGGDPQRIAETGRLLSGIYMAAAAGALAAALFLARGPVAGVAAGLFFLSFPEAREIMEKGEILQKFPEFQPLLESFVMPSGVCF